MTMRPAVEISTVVKRFGDLTALADVLMTIEANVFLTLIGPSGCGKTTLLLLISTQK